MLPKHQRLTGADIQYLLRKGKKIYGNTFVFVSIPQYANRGYHQMSVQIPVKVDKRSTWRNMLKRLAVDIGWPILTQTSTISKLKVFVFVNKTALPILQELIATQEKTTITKQRQDMCQQDFITFVEHAGK